MCVCRCCSAVGIVRIMFGTTLGQFFTDLPQSVYSKVTRTFSKLSTRSLPLFTFVCTGYREETLSEAYQKMTFKIIQLLQNHVHSYRNLLKTYQKSAACCAYLLLLDGLTECLRLLVCPAILSGHSNTIPGSLRTWRLRGPLEPLGTSKSLKTSSRIVYPRTS